MKRLWVDANVMLRFLTKDPPALAGRAARLMARAERGEIVLYVSPLVLTEIIRVLKSFYRYAMTEIAQALIALVSASGIEVDDRALSIRAVELSRDRNVDFVDAYLALQAAAHKEPVCTFDEADFKRLPVEWVMPE
jgi:predicted nucleic acid-binding protein